MRLRSITAAAAVALSALLAGAAPAGACAGLVTPGGNVRLTRTATLAAFHGGVEHYVTSFRFEGGGAEFGSIVPLPGVPSKVERGGDWTLQRLDRETHPVALAASDSRAGAPAAEGATVVYETKIDALDITILRGGGPAVGDWARQHGYQLTPDAPEVLDFYARRSKIFMAARFDAQAAKQRGQDVGDGTPIHLTIPTRNPWVPLRILGLGVEPDKQVDADVYLLTDRRPALLPEPGAIDTFQPRNGMSLRRSDAASESLLNDLRSDKGMEWLPTSMWLTYVAIDGASRDLHHDLAIDASGRGRPSFVAAGLTPPPPPSTTTVAPTTSAPTTVAPVTSPPSSEIAAARLGDDSRRPAPAGIEAGALLLLVAVAGVVLVRRRSPRSPTR